MCPLFFTIFKRNVFLPYFQRSTLKINLTDSRFFFPLFHEDFFSPGLPRTTRLFETSCLENITVCVIDTMLVTLPLVQMNKVRRPRKPTNQVQTKINIMKGLQTSVIHLIPVSTCHWISSQMRCFKKYLLVETFSSNN